VDDDLHHQTGLLRSSVIAMGERTDEMLAGALAALTAGDLAVADGVIADDAQVDRAYEQIQHGVLAVVAMHRPVGRDLRLLTSMIHVSLHLERMGDYASNVARTVKRSAMFPADRDLTDQLLEMGELARAVGSRSVTAFVDGDAGLAHEVTGLDDAVDRLNLGIFHRLVRLATEDEARLEWAARMIQLTRQLERFADHGVDIAEQAVFVATGEVIDLAVKDA
jgi:phosphate transport system protein